MSKKEDPFVQTMVCKIQELWKVAQQPMIKEECTTIFIVPMSSSDGSYHDPDSDMIHAELVITCNMDYFLTFNKVELFPWISAKHEVDVGHVVLSVESHIYDGYYKKIMTSLYNKLIHVIPESGGEVTYRHGVIRINIIRDEKTNSNITAGSSKKKKNPFVRLLKFLCCCSLLAGVDNIS